MEHKIRRPPVILFFFLFQQVVSNCSPLYNSQLYAQQPTSYTGSQPTASLCPNCIPPSQPSLPPLCPPEAPIPPKIDPVSLSLALQAQQQCIREDKLNFGPNRLPVDGRLFKCPKDVYEEGLHVVNRQVVELRPTCPRKTLAEEAAESYLDEDEYNLEACNKPYLTYSDLGYVPERPKCNVFVPGAPAACPTPQGQVVYSGPATCQCQQVSTCYSSLPQCSSPNVYQPGGLYMTQVGCRNAACSPEYPCPQCSSEQFTPF